MDSSVLRIAMASACGAFALAACNVISDEAEYGRVVQVTPAKETVRTPRQVCSDVPVSYRQPERDGEIGGTVAGAVVGGLLGNQVGSGSGRKAATVAGAVAGGYVGREVDRRHEGGQVVQGTEQRCETAYDTHEKVVGYDVAYEYEGQTHTVRMDEAPSGDRIPLKTVVTVDD